MENIQVINDGADEEDLKELLEILKGFGQVEVLYDPSDPKDKDVTADEVIERYDNFKKKVKEAHIKLLDTQLAQQTELTKYWKNKYEKCLEELKKKEELNKKTDCPEIKDKMNRKR